MLLDKKSKKLKEAIRIQNRLNYLYKVKYKLPKIKLDVDIEREIKYLDDKFKSGRLWRYMDISSSYDSDYENAKKRLVKKILDRETKERE